jgi:hypothetical protein
MYGPMYVIFVFVIDIALATAPGAPCNTVCFKHTHTLHTAIHKYTHSTSWLACAIDKGAASRYDIGRWGQALATGTTKGGTEHGVPIYRYRNTRHKLHTRAHTTRAHEDEQTPMAHVLSAT